MRIAIPTANNKICPHFGHCEVFTMVDVNEKTMKIEAMNDVVPPAHAPGVLPAWLHEQGAHIILAGGMGQRAQNMFTANGIEVIVGVTAGDPETLVKQYLAGELVAGENICDH
ncbi:MAG: ATPase [Spartobacteria bacterium]|nr:ATPase [Spartobacteria bacterium]